MGLHFFSRKASFNLIEVGLCQLGGSRNGFMFKNNSFYKLYRGASAVSLLSDSDSDSDSSSNGVRNNLIGDILVSRKQSLRNNKGFVRLSSMVVRVLKSLDWEAARLISFKRAVGQFGFSCAIDAFRMILCIFSSAEMSNEVFVMLKSMIYYYASGRTKFNLLEFLVDFPSAANVVMVDALVKVFACNKMLEDAVDVYISAKEMGVCPGIRPCNFLLKCLLENGREDALLALFEDMKNTSPSPNVFTYTIMMNFYCNGKPGQHNVDMVEANNILHEMKANGISPTVVTYGTYFKGLVRGGYAEATVNLMHDLICDSQPINVYYCNAVIDALCREKKLDEAMGIFKEMSRCKIAPDVYTYSILVRGLCEIGEIQKGFLLLVDMENNNDLKPSLVTYIPLLKGLCRSGLVDASLQLFRDVCSRVYELDQIAYSILIGGFCDEGNLDFARELLNEMIRSDSVPYASEQKSSVNRFSKAGFTNWRDSKLYVHLVNEIADGYCKKGFVNEALKFLHEMRYQGVDLNIISYSIIIKWLCEKGNSAEALLLIPLMMKQSMLPNVVIFSALISGFARQSDIKMALTLYRSMEKFGVRPNTVTYTSLISYYLKKNNFELAYNFFEQMTQNGTFPDAVTYTTWIYWFCKNNDMKNAYMWFKEMDRQGCFPSVKTYTVLAYGFLRQHRIDKAMEVMNEMKRRGVSPDVTTYNVLIHGCLITGEKGIARDIFVNMKKKGILPNERTLSMLDQFRLG